MYSKVFLYYYAFILSQFLEYPDDMEEKSSKNPRILIYHLNLYHISLEIKINHAYQDIILINSSLIKTNKKFKYHSQYYKKFFLPH